MVWDGMLDDFDFEECLAERKKIKAKTEELANQIKIAVTEYNKFTEENDLRNFFLYVNIADHAYLPNNWNKDDETSIDDIIEYVLSHPGWNSSSARC